MIALVLASIVAAAPTPPADLDSWQGFWPGEAYADVVAQNGQPIFTHRAPDGSVVTYNRMKKNADAYVVLITQSGLVQEIGVTANRAAGSMAGLTDPSGVSIGFTADKLKAKRGAPSVPAAVGGTAEYLYKGARGIWAYEFNKGVIVYISLSSPHPPPAHPATGNDDPRDGSSIDKALVLTARSEDEGTHFEYYYANTLPPCAGDWNPAHQALIAKNGHQYDRIDLVCALNESKQTLFFDVTSYFGKF